MKLSGFLFIGLLLTSSGWLSRWAIATDYYVDPAGKGLLGNGTRTYTTVQAALNAVPAGTASSPTRVLVYPGTYTEQLSITKQYIDLIGRSPDASQTVFTFNLTAADPTPNASTTVNTSHFTAANVTFANSTPIGSNGKATIQALAMYNQGDENAFQNCRFIGFQDTLYTANGRSYFNNCYISGTTDFIYGSSTAVINNSTINIPYMSGHVTAANTSANKPIGFVIMNSTLTGAGSHTTDLGRPWQYDRGSYANVMYVNDKIGTQITTGLWHPWDVALNIHPAGDSRYAEFGLTDLNGIPLNTANFVTSSHVLSQADVNALTLPHIFGPASFWDFTHWGVGNSTIWGPVNAVGTSNVTTAITATSFTDWSLGGTWDPSIQLSTVTVPEPELLAALGAMLIACASMRVRIR